MVAVVEVAPAAIVAEAGPVTAALFEVSVIVRPPTGAAELIVIVPVVLAEPKTVVGFRVNPASVGAVTVRAACAVVELPAAVIVQAVSVATATVVIVAVPEVAPAAIVRVAGVAAVELEVSVTG